MKRNILIALMLAISISFYAQHPLLTQDYLSFRRETMQFEDEQLLLFNGRGFISPMEFSMTSFTNVQFLPFALRYYVFCINMLEKETGILIRDDVASEWKKWTDQGYGWDPLGANFRPYAPMVVVTQDEEWKPNLYTRTGTFYKNISDKTINLSLCTATCVSGEKDEALIKYRIRNRDNEPVTLIMQPAHINLEEHGFKVEKTPYEVFINDTWEIAVSADIEKCTDNGYEVTIAPGEIYEMNFSVTFSTSKLKVHKRVRKDIAKNFVDAQSKIQNTLLWASKQLPEVYTGIENIDQLYYRSILSVLMCRNSRENFIINPFWSVGIWPYTISWDNSFASDILAMLEPESLKETIRLNFAKGKMQKTYIAWDGNFLDILYIQEPFAVQIMLEAYMKHTGSADILTEFAGEYTFYEWMKKWAEELHNNYGQKDGLIDVGYSTEKIIEIRTDGYNHIVPVVNALTMDLYGKLSEWANLLGNKQDAIKFDLWKSQIHNSINEKLWNKEKQWFNNLYPDGTTDQIYTYHIFDIIASNNITNEQRIGLISHLKNKVFLGKFGVYSIARNDLVHWDRIDCDWGGGGQYAGMPGRIVRNLYKIGNSQLGWDILNRYAGYTEYFPYLSQNPSIDKPLQDRSSMPVQIAGGAAAEAILFGTFGISLDFDSISFSPVYHTGMKNARVRNFRWRDHVYDLILKSDVFEVYKDSVLMGSEAYGNKVAITY